MASANKVITIDLGTSTLKVAEFGVSRGGALTLLRFGVAELGLDPNKEEERAKFITPPFPSFSRRVASGAAKSAFPSRDRASLCASSNYLPSIRRKSNRWSSSRRSKTSRSPLMK